MAVTNQIERAAPPEDGAPDELLARTRQAARHAARAGDFAPTFRLPDVHGGNRALIDLIEQGPLVLSFYRGVWCDFCDEALETLGRLDGKIRDLGAMHVAIGPGAGSDAERSRLKTFPMPVLADRGLKVTASYGLSISLPDQLEERYASFGYGPIGTGDTGTWKISVPATYVIGMDGRIVMAVIDADYRHRMQPDHLMSALRGLRHRRAP